MTYEELWLNATYLLDHNKITLGEFEEMIEPLKHEISEQTEPQRGCDADCNEDCTECAKEWQDWKDQMWAEAVEASKTEPQTDGYMTAEQAEDYRKMLDKAEHKVYGNIEDEPQTEVDCSWK